MGLITKTPKSKCSVCGANDIVYQLGTHHLSICPHCLSPLEYDEHCTCISSNIVDCNVCKENPKIKDNK